MAPELFGGMAKESLDAEDTPEDLASTDGLVTHKVDVFSFGVTLWEIWMFGETPYAAMDTAKVMNGVMAGELRPPVPPHCDGGFAKLMADCWEANSRMRPSFSKIAEALQDIVAKNETAGA